MNEILYCLIWEICNLFSIMKFYSVVGFLGYRWWFVEYEWKDYRYAIRIWAYQIKLVHRNFTFILIFQLSDLPAKVNLVTSHVPLVDRGGVGAKKHVYMGDNLHSSIPAYGRITKWQFHSKHNGTGAFQVWRRRYDLTGDMM